MRAEQEVAVGGSARRHEMTKSAVIAEEQRVEAGTSAVGTEVS